VTGESDSLPRSSPRRPEAMRKFWRGLQAENKHHYFIRQNSKQLVTPIQRWLSGCPFRHPSLCVQKLGRADVQPVPCTSAEWRGIQALILLDGQRRSARTLQCLQVKTCMLWAAARNIFLPDTYLRPHEREGVRDTGRIVMYVSFGRMRLAWSSRCLLLQGSYTFTFISV